MSKKTTKKQSEVKKIDNNMRVVQRANDVYAFSTIASTYPTLETSTSGSSLWEVQPLNFGGFNVVPFGSTNNLPKELRAILDDYNLGEGIFKRQRGLVWGQGPELYIPKFTEGKKIKEWTEDSEILSWLKSFNYETYLMNLTIDANHMEGCFSKIFLDRGARIGRQTKIAKLEHVPIHKCCFEFPDDRQTPKRILTAIDWEYNYTYGITPYNIFDRNNPFAYPVSMFYSNIYSFARDFYTYPSWYGGRHWMTLSGYVPKILKALSDNSLNFKCHVKSPAKYWSDQKARLEEQCANKGTKYTDQLLEDLKDEIFTKLSELMTGVDNFGKFFTSESIMNEFGNLEEWKIEVIDLKLSDVINSQIAISNKADSATTSAIGLAPSLSNIMVDNKLASGSEKLYDFKLYLATETDIIENIICKVINDAIAINFPGKNIKLGFYHDVVLTEEATSPQNRLKNN